MIDLWMLFIVYITIGASIWYVGCDPDEPVIQDSPLAAHLIVLLMMVLAWPIVITCWLTWRE